MLQQIPRFTQFCDLLLVELYDAERRSPGLMLNLFSLAANLKEPVPRTWYVDAAKVLKARGWADVSLTFGGALARIAGEGRLYVEAGRGAVGEIRDRPELFFRVAADRDADNALVGDAPHRASHAQQETPLLVELKEVETRLETDVELTPDEKDELLANVRVVRAQARKRNPDHSLIAAVLEPLSKVTSIAGNIANVVKLVNG